MVNTVYKRLRGHEHLCLQGGHSTENIEVLGNFSHKVAGERAVKVYVPNRRTKYAHLIFSHGHRGWEIKKAYVGLGHRGGESNSLIVPKFALKFTSIQVRPSLVGLDR